MFSAELSPTSTSAPNAKERRISRKRTKLKISVYSKISFHF